MFETALRWMGARWWAAAAIAATTIVLFRMSEVGAPSSVTPHSPDSHIANAVRSDVGVTNASFRRQPTGNASLLSDLEFLELRSEISDLKSALLLSKKRATLLSDGYQSLLRQYKQISSLARLLMDEAGHHPSDQARAPITPARLQLALARMRALAAARENTMARPASAPRGLSGVPVPTEAIYIQTADARHDSKQ